MKRILIGIGLFAFGLAIGAGIAGLVAQRLYQRQMAWLVASNVGLDVLLAQQLRTGNAQILLESADQRIVRGVFELHRNKQMKDLMITEETLKSAKEYYTCAKMEFPPEIAPILNDLPPVAEDRCPIE